MPRLEQVRIGLQIILCEIIDVFGGIKSLRAKSLYIPDYID
jgi:hypothetical protein